MKDTTNQNLKKKKQKKNTSSGEQHEEKPQMQELQFPSCVFRILKNWKQLRDSISASYYWLGWKTKRRNRKKITANSIRDRLEGC